MSHMEDTETEWHLSTEATPTAVNAAGPGTLLGTLSQSSMLLTCNISRHSFGWRLIAHPENVLGPVQKLTLARENSQWQLGWAHLLWRVREFNSMDRFFHAIWSQSQSWGHLIDSYVHYLWLFVPSYHEKQVLLFQSLFNYFLIRKFEVIIRDHCFFPPICAGSCGIFWTFTGKTQNWAPIQDCSAVIPIFISLLWVEVADIRPIMVIIPVIRCKTKHRWYLIQP